MTHVAPRQLGKGDGQPSMPPTSIGASLVPLMLVLFISTLDQTIVASALSGIGTALHNGRDAPWIATAYLLTSAVSTLIFGKLGDMLGRKSTLQAAVSIFVLGSALCAVAPSMAYLIAFRALQGVGGGGLNSLVMAVVADLAPARVRARYQGILGMVPALAIISGPILGGVIIDHVSWTWIFLINLPIGVVALAMIAGRLHLPVRRRARRLDLGGAVLAMLFTTGFLMTTVWGSESYGWTAWQTLALATATVASLIAYVAVERTASEPITPLFLFRDPTFLICSTLFFVATGVLFVCLLYVPMLLQRVFHLTASAAGGCIVPVLFGLIAAAAISGIVISRTGRYKAFPIAGAILCVFGFAMLARVKFATPLWEMLVWLGIIGIGLGFFIQVAVLAGQNAVEYAHLGVATGALNFFKTLGGATGAALFGAMLSAKLVHAGSAHEVLEAYQWIFIIAAMMMGCTLSLALFIRETPLSADMIDIAEGHRHVPEY